MALLIVDAIGLLGVVESCCGFISCETCLWSVVVDVDVAVAVVNELLLSVDELVADRC